MGNVVNLQRTNDYLQQFQLAQRNLNLLIQEERLHKRIQKSKRQFIKHTSLKKTEIPFSSFPVFK